MSRRKAISNARRLKSAVQRTEQEPYDFTSDRRPPRLGGGGTYFFFRADATLAAATGSWPNLTPGSIASQTIYRSLKGVQTALQGTFTVYNWKGATVATGKTADVLPNGDGTWSVVTQSC